MSEPPVHATVNGKGAEEIRDNPSIESDDLSVSIPQYELDHDGPLNAGCCTVPFTYLWRWPQIHLPGVQGLDLQRARVAMFFCVLATPIYLVTQVPKTITSNNPRQQYRWIEISTLTPLMLALPFIMKFWYSRLVLSSSVHPTGTENRELRRGLRQMLDSVCMFQVLSLSTVLLMSMWIDGFRSTSLCYSILPYTWLLLLFPERPVWMTVCFPLFYGAAFIAATVSNDNSLNRSEAIAFYNQIFGAQALLWVSVVVHSSIVRQLSSTQANQRLHIISLMSHELRTPLQGILGHLSLLKSTRDWRHMREIEVASHRLLSLHDTLNAFSLLEAGKLHFARERFSPSELINTVVNSVLASVDAQGVWGSRSAQASVVTTPRQRPADDRLRVHTRVGHRRSDSDADAVYDADPFADLTPRDPHRVRISMLGSTMNMSVSGSRHGLSFIVGRFLSNACKFTDPSASVEIKVSLVTSIPEEDAASAIPLEREEWSTSSNSSINRKSLLVEVLDEGPGVPPVPKHRAEMFLPSFVVPTSNFARLRHHRGTGMGLYLASRMTAMLGGTLGCRNRTDNACGSVFWVCVPISDPDVQTLRIESMLSSTSKYISPYLSAVSQSPHELSASQHPRLRVVTSDSPSQTVPSQDSVESKHDMARSKELVPSTLPRHQSGSPTTQPGKMMPIRSVTDSSTPQLRPAPLHIISAEEKRKRILVVDDTRMNLELLGMMVEHAGFEAVLANDGLEAVEAIRLAFKRPSLTPLADAQSTSKPGPELLTESGKGVARMNTGDGTDVAPTEEHDPFDLVLMDIQMPRMNGFEATKAIRISLGLSPDVLPVVAVSAGTIGNDVAQAKLCGMQGYYSKPISLRTLKSVVQRHTEERVSWFAGAGF